MTKRVRVHQPSAPKPDTPSWVLEVYREERDPGGRYEFVRPTAAAEIVQEHNERRRRKMALPESSRLTTMRDVISDRGWRITRSTVNHNEFLGRALMPRPGY